MDQKRKLFECSIRNHVSFLGYYLKKHVLFQIYHPEAVIFHFKISKVNLKFRFLIYASNDRLRKSLTLVNVS